MCKESRFFEFLESRLFVRRRNAKASIFPNVMENSGLNTFNIIVYLTMKYNLPKNDDKF